MGFRSPVALARVASNVAVVEDAAFWRSPSGPVDHDEDEEPVNLDLGLDPTDAKGLDWRDRNWVEAELEAASVRD